VALGFDPALYWSITPREMDALRKGAVRRLRREHDQMMAAAWWSGVIAKSQKTPPLERLLSREAQHRQTPEEKLAIVQQWASVAAKR